MASRIFVSYPDFLIVFNDFPQHFRENQVRERMAAEAALRNRQQANRPGNRKSVLLF